MLVMLNILIVIGMLMKLTISDGITGVIIL